MDDSHLVYRRRRHFSLSDGKWWIKFVLILVTVPLIYWYLLLAIQWLIVPTSPAGENRIWVLRPERSARVFSVMMLSLASVLLLYRNRRPSQTSSVHDGVIWGSRYSPLQLYASARRLYLYVICFPLMLIVFLSSLAITLFSWVVVRQDGIEQHFAWITWTYSLDDIESLETFAEGKSTSLSKSGPWYQIKFRDGRFFSFGPDNEGTSTEELKAIAAHIVERAELTP